VTSTLTKKTTIQKLTVHTTFLIFFLVISLVCLNSYANSIDDTSTWLLTPFEHIDELNKKDPALALSFSTTFLNDNHQKMTDIETATLLAKMARHNYFLGNYSDSQQLLDRVYALNVDLTSNLGISILLTQGGVTGEVENMDKAMEKFLLAEKYARANENLRLLADTYSYMAYAYSNVHNDSDALKYYHQAYLLFEQLDDELNMIYLKAEMSDSYSLLFDDKKAIELAKTASEYFNKHQYYFDELFTQNKLAKIYHRKKDYLNAEMSYLRVIELTKKTNKRQYVYLAFLGLADTYHHSQQPKKARVFWNKYIENQPSYDNPLARTRAIILEIKLAIFEKNISAATSSLKELEALMDPLNPQNALSWYVQLFDLQAQVAVLQKDFRSAYFKQKEARALQKNYYNTEREAVRSKLKVMFDTDQAMLKNKLLEQDKALNKAALEGAAQQQKLQNIIIMVISLFVLILFYFIYRQVINSKALNKIANTDSLTELANRRYSFIYAEKMLLQATKTQQNFSMIVFDVDLFKKVNDNFGHGGGDIALKELSATANKYVRNHDILGRIGGEEFLLVLPAASAIQAYEIAERIRLAIEKKVITIEGKTLQITASFGVAELTEQQVSVNQIFNSADTALYQAKSQGRNQVVMAK
jgi:diguanylate cyclase (GGDEF)-like protein